jgi:hypothetical protein
MPYIIFLFRLFNFSFPRPNEENQKIDVLLDSFRSYTVCTVATTVQAICKYLW